MIATTPQLAAFMDTARAGLRVDLYTLTAPNGQVLRGCGGDAALLLPVGRLFAKGPLLSRGRIELRAGIEVDEMSVEITPAATDLLGGIPLLRAAREGALRGCELLLEWAYLDTNGVLQGVLPKFSGRGSPTAFQAGTITLDVRSELERLLTMMPRDVYQPTCLNTVYDPACGKPRAAMRVASTVNTVSSRSSFATALTEPAGWFDKGLLRFTSGLNNGDARTVRGYAGGAFSFALPFLRDIAPGDVFEVFPGCDGTQATCTSKFSNLARFRGQPYIPAPEAAL